MDPREEDANTGTVLIPYLLTQYLYLDPEAPWCPMNAVETPRATELYTLAAWLEVLSQILEHPSPPSD